MLDMAILGLLEERDLHGYEIRRQLRDQLGILANVSFGSIYPALTRLENAGPWWPPRTPTTRHPAPARPGPAHRLAQRRAGRAPGPPPRRLALRRGKRSTGSPSGRGSSWSS